MSESPAKKGDRTMLFMVIERFKNRDARAIYSRVLKEGRKLPEGLTYVNSWVEANFERCFQVMECSDARVLQQWVLQQWVLQWHDLAEFEIVPVVTSQQTVEMIQPLL